MQRNKAALFLLVLLAFIVCGCRGIEFKPLPRSRDATNNRNAVLRCGVFGPGATDYKISWIVDAKNVTSNSRRFQRGNNLHFEPIDKDFDSGEFQCVATLKNNSRVEMISVPSAKFNIKWVEAESVDLRSPRLKTDVLPGVRVVLRCSINGNPKPSNISWLVNGAVLNTAPTGVEIRNRRLIIASAVLKANDGVYTCCALSHPLGKRCTPQEKGFSLQVIEIKTRNVFRLGNTALNKFMKRHDQKLHERHDQKLQPTSKRVIQGTGRHTV